MNDIRDSRRTREHFSGCLLGGAIGDALGAPIEFLDLAEIRDKYGPAGITDFDFAYGRQGAITDDTQMTLFTAEGLLRATVDQKHKGVSPAASVVHHAYLRWLHTQGERSRSEAFHRSFDGWLIGVHGLHDRRAPGMTCLAALRGETMGTMDRPLNDSKGCGGVMRAAPVGLVARDEGSAFQIGCEIAAITHGHPSGYYSAGCFAAIIRSLTDGHSLPQAIERGVRLLSHARNSGREECVDAIDRAVALWRDPNVGPSPEAVERLGKGWVGEEALAIALYCALCEPDDFRAGVLLAVNHSGDCDSTGAIAGNLLGLMLGAAAIPATWRDGLELRAEIETVAADLHTGYDDSPAWLMRYPGNEIV
jgi:ADP-ribosylglycohydrolase